MVTLTLTPYQRSLDGKTYFVGCSEWKKIDPERMHQFIPIPFNVDQDDLLKMIQNHGEVEGDDEAVVAKCALVVPRRIRAKMKQCRKYRLAKFCPALMCLPSAYPHIKDGQVVVGQMIIRECPADMQVFVPLDQDDHRACIVPGTTPHNHPVYADRKLSAHAKHKYVEDMEVFGAMGATVSKVDKGVSH